MRPALRIRQTDDLDAVSEMDRVCFPTDSAIDEDTLAHSVWWFAELEGRPVAYAGLLCQHPGTAQVGAYEKAFLCRAGVLPEARGTGLQVRLIRARVAFAKRVGVPRVYTYVATCGVASMRSLVKCGFLPYYYRFDNPGAFIYLEKKLTPKPEAHYALVEEVR